MADPQHTDARKDRRFLALQAEFEDTFLSLTSKFQFDELGYEGAVREAAGRFEKLIQSASGPAFDDDGYIAPSESAPKPK